MLYVCVIFQGGDKPDIFKCETSCLHPCKWFVILFTCIVPKAMQNCQKLCITFSFYSFDTFISKQTCLDDRRCSWTILTVNFENINKILLNINTCTVDVWLVETTLPLPLYQSSWFWNWTASPWCRDFLLPALNPRWPCAVLDSLSIISCYRVIKMAIVHDMAEAIVGDITPHCGVSDLDKHTQEKVRLVQTFSFKNCGWAINGSPKTG